MDRITSQFRRALQVISSAGYRFYIDDGFSAASALAYTTLFAIVPLCVIIFLMFNLFQIDEVQVSELLRTSIERFLTPIIQVREDQVHDLENTIFTFLQQFITSGRALSTVSIALFVFTGIALFNTMESALNGIWRVTSERSFVVKVTNFWAVLTLAPILIAVSIYWTTTAQLFNEAYTPLLRLTKIFNFFVPVGATWAALTLLYLRLPAARLRFRDAAFGGILAALLFELAKIAFAYYVTQSLTYTKLYGVLATIFLFLLWLYIVWVIVLFGAQICYQSGSLKILTGLKKYSTELGGVGILLGLQLLYVISRNFSSGQQPPSEGELAIATGADPVLVRTCLEALEKSGLLCKRADQQISWLLVKDPEKVSLEEISDTFIQKEFHMALSKAVKEKPDNEPAFFEIIRRTSLRKDPAEPWTSWKLADLV